MLPYNSLGESVSNWKLHKSILCLSGGSKRNCWFILITQWKTSGVCQSRCHPQHLNRNKGEIERADRAADRERVVGEIGAIIV